MGLNTDTTKAIRGSAARAHLVNEIFNAPPNTPETDWLEWKSEVNLKDARWQAELARQILGFGNRMPDRARANAEGYGYVVLGVAPGRCPGVRPYDSAVLESWISPYLGATGPRWEPFYVPYNGLQVLVVQTDPPQWGDPVFPLRKTFDRWRDGMILVRRKGQIEQATSAEYDALVKRASASSSGLAVRIGWWQDQAPDPIRPVEITLDAIETWIERERASLRPTETPASKVSPPFDRLMMQLSREKRTPEEYAAQVDRYLTRCRAALSRETIALYIEEVATPLPFAVTNLTEHNYADCSVVLAIEGEVAAYFDPDEVREDHMWPSRPRPWGQPSPVDFGLVRPFNLSELGAPAGRLPRGHIDNSGSTKIEFDDVHLRPAHSHRLEEVFLVVKPAHVGQALVGRWHATSTSVSGYTTGEIEIPMASEPITLDEIWESSQS